jgi:hypothetical protein
MRFPPNDRGRTITEAAGSLDDGSKWAGPGWGQLPPSDTILTLVLPGHDN